MANMLLIAGRKVEKTVEKSRKTGKENIVLLILWLESLSK